MKLIIKQVKLKNGKKKLDQKTYYIKQINIKMVFNNMKH